MATNKRKKASRKRKTAAMSWLWEFSKKVVWTVTILYAVSFVFAMLISWQGSTVFRKHGGNYNAYYRGKRNFSGGSRRLHD